MDEYVINEIYHKAIRLLNERRLKEALSELEYFLHDIPEWDIKDKLESIDTSYKYMLRYMEQGSQDPERDKLYRKMVTDAYDIADRARIMRLTGSSTGYYFDRTRYHRMMPMRSLKELQLELESYTGDIAVSNLLQEEEQSDLMPVRKRHEAALSEVFYQVWTAGKWKEEEAEEARNFLDSLLIQINNLALFVSALTLSLSEQFDIKKLMLLFDAYQHPSNEVNQRAIVGLALIIYQYDNRLSLYPEVEARITLLNEDTLFSNNLSRIQIQLLRCRETKKIDKKMREEIIPEMIRNAPNMKLGPENQEEEGGDDRNPDWQDWMEESGLNDKLREISELQMEGADVYMNTFAQLKTFPFFREMSNWFYPFDIQHSAVVEAFGTTWKKRNIVLDTILQSDFFCNSDKYSFCFTMMQVPQAQRDMMEQQFRAQNEALDEAKRYDKMIAFSQEVEILSNQYIHDLYRFYKLFPRRQEFHDFFDDSLNLQNCKTLKDTLSDTSNKVTLAGYFFHKGYLAEALSLYQDITEETGGDAETFQKIGYCYQKQNKFEEAISSYLQADILKPDNIWTNRSLAKCYRSLKQYGKALEYYRKVEAVQPDNITILSQIGHCLAEEKKCDEALNYFFKIELLDNENPKAWRPIAWCSFVTGKHTQAMKYYNKLLEASPNIHDFLNAGHVAWSLGEIYKAVEYYEKAIKRSKDWNDFLSLFNKDKEDLIIQGIRETEIPLMLDLLRYRY
ncbi:MAG: hypothetical protein LUE93_11270 [Bacteroides sp.]|nr:hypothetical protein [Bacteroides sp.]